MGQKRHKRPGGGNPYGLAWKQHFIPRETIGRFADAKGHVKILRKRDKAVQFKTANDDAFWVDRAWSARLESLKTRDGGVIRGLLTEIDDAFQAECDNVLSTTFVRSHQAISDYWFAWHQRSAWAKNPPQDLVLVGVEQPPLGDEIEQRLEAKGAAFGRGNLIPGHVQSWLEFRVGLDRFRAENEDTRWDIIGTLGSVGFVCSDVPAYTRFIPIARHLGLWVAEGQGLPDAETVARLNRDALERAEDFVFGHPEDIDRLKADLKAAKAK